MDKIELFNHIGPYISISMKLYFNEEGQLIFDGYDQGKGVSDTWGDSDYEYNYTIEPSNIDRLYSVLNVEKGNRRKLLLELKKQFGNNTEYSAFGKFMTDNNIKYKSFTWR